VRVPLGSSRIFFGRSGLLLNRECPHGDLPRVVTMGEAGSSQARSLPVVWRPVTIHGVSRITHRRAAGAALLVLAMALLHACDHRGSRVVSPAGLVWDRITPPEATEADRPDWHGDSITFQVSAQGLDRVAVAREDGSGLEIEPELSAAGARSPRWVRGGLLAYSSDLAGSEDLWYREVATGRTRRLTAFPGMEWTPAPRPGSPGLVYVEGVDPDSGRLVLVPDTSAAPLGKIYLTPASLHAGEPNWSPAGDQICFSTREPNGTSQIWRLSLTDTVAIQLTVAPSSSPPGVPQLDRGPKWSPDGSRILMASNRGGLWGVWALSPSGEAQGLAVIAQDLPGSELRHPTWSADGKAILVSTNRSGDRALWKLSHLEY